MNHFISLFLLVFSTIAFSKSAVVTVKPKDFKIELQEARRMGFDIAGVNLENQTFDIVLPVDSLEYFKHEINKNVVSVSEVRLDPQYKKAEDVETALRTFVANYPELARTKIMGTSVEGRSIWAIKLSSDVVERKIEKKVVLFNSMHHAREVMTTEVALDIIDFLLKNYQTDPKVKNWLDTTEVWVVPMLNPDGNNKVWTTNNMWRKNARAPSGVDINRNYPFGWNSCNGSSGSSSSDTYRGPSPASEPETQALMQLVADIKPQISISFHSYSELVIYPFGCRSRRLEGQDKVLIEGMGKELAAKLPRDSGSGSYAPGTAYELLYEVDGGDIDWMYSEHKVIPFVIELNGSSQGFQPSYTRWRDTTVQKARAGWQFILDRVHGELLK